MDYILMEPAGEWHSSLVFQFGVPKADDFAYCLTVSDAERPWTRADVPTIVQFLGLSLRENHTPPPMIVDVLEKVAFSRAGHECWLSVR